MTKIPLKQVYKLSMTFAWRMVRE